MIIHAKHNAQCEVNTKHFHISCYWYCASIQHLSCWADNSTDN